MNRSMIRMTTQFLDQLATTTSQKINNKLIKKTIGGCVQSAPDSGDAQDHYRCLGKMG